MLGGGIPTDRISDSMDPRTRSVTLIEIVIEIS